MAYPSQRSNLCIDHTAAIGWLHGPPLVLVNRTRSSLEVYAELDSPKMAREEGESHEWARGAAAEARS